jgi:hypothetical protein
MAEFANHYQVLSNQIQDVRSLVKDSKKNQVPTINTPEAPDRYLSGKETQCGKAIEKLTDLDKVYNALLQNELTMRQIDLVTGIRQHHVCRRIADLREQGKVGYAGKVKCPSTGRRAWLCTTDRSRFLTPTEQQLELFS